MAIQHSEQTSQRTGDRNQLSVDSLEKRFGSEFELSCDHLTVGTDEIVALLGPSGCGKTTFLRCIAGVETPEAGRIEIDDELVFGENVSKPPEKRDIGMVYQNYAIWPHKTVYENVVFPLKHTPNEFPESEYEDRVDEMLELMEIQELKQSPATELSGGQQQRTALARSLINDPDLLLLDEPLSNLDRELRKQMRYELQRLQHELDVSMLYVTHDQEEAFYLADRVCVINDGAFVERGTPKELYRRPSSPFTRKFLGVRNQFSGSIERSASGETIVRTDLLDFSLDSAEYISNGSDTEDVVCFLSPSDITIPKSHRETNGHIKLSGTVVAEGILGKHHEITVECDRSNTELIVHTTEDREYDRGDRVELQFQPEQLQVYDTDAK